MVKIFLIWAFVNITSVSPSLNRDMLFLKSEDKNPVFILGASESREILDRVDTGSSKFTDGESILASNDCGTAVRKGLEGSPTETYFSFKTQDQLFFSEVMEQ